MSRASTSLELSEFFSNDDSDGHRLAEFLQKRRGGAQRQNFLFMNCETQRLSLKVQLEKLPPKQQEKSLEKVGENVHAGNERDESIDTNTVVASVKQIAAQHSDTNEKITSPCLNTLTNDHIPERPSNQSLSNERVLQVLPDRPQLPASPSRSPTFLNPVSPRLSTIRKNGEGISPSDRLRRYSLKRLTKMCVGRRTLLHEFESTLSDTNFDPPVCSTPLSQPLPEKTPLSITSCERPDVENGSCCGHTNTLIRTLQRKDDELKNYMESILENTLRKIQSQEKEDNSATRDNNKTNDTSNAAKSPLKRTNTLESGNAPGEVILISNQGATEQNPRHSKSLRSGKELSTRKNLKTSLETRSIASIRVKRSENLVSPEHINSYMSQAECPSNPTKLDIFNEGSGKLEASRQQPRRASSSNVGASFYDVPKTPLNNVSIVLPTQDVDIPESQVGRASRNNSIIVQAGHRPVVVIPITQTFNKSFGEEILNNNSKTKHCNKPTPNLSAQQIQETFGRNDDRCNQMAEDNLKLTDILTDDEEETPKPAVSPTIENNSQLPLNLAQSATNTRTKRLRKRTNSRRRFQMDNSQLLNTETETELPPQAHSGRRTIKRNKIPLNRAPGTPLNGEKFAQELARMSNYEILDLRKRNSIGCIFAKSGRKTRKIQDAVKKQRELDCQIQLELLRRNLDEETDRHIAQNNKLSEVEKIDEFPPVPDEFRDWLATQQQTINCSGESSLIGEKSSDRVSFKSKGNSAKQLKRSSRLKRKQMTELLQQYLEVSKTLSEKKTRRSNSLNKIKRSLYTQGHSDSGESNSSQDKNILEETRSNTANRKLSIPYIPSPPKVNQITSIKVVSPPPSLIITPRKSQNRKLQQTTINYEKENSHHTTVNVNEIESLPPPPPGFGSDSGESSNNFNSTVNAVETTNVITTNTTTVLNTENNRTDNDDHVFKKPQHPVPKRRARKLKVSTTSSNNLPQTANDSQQSENRNSVDTTDGSLRRSKRGQVPLKHPVPIFQMLFQKTINMHIERHEKEKLRKISEANKSSAQKSTKALKQKQKKRLSPVPEGSPLLEQGNVSLEQDAEVLNKKKAPKIKKSKVKRKNERTNENFECSRIVLSQPPPVDHLNKVFDQLKNTSSTLITSQTTPHPSSSQVLEQIKPLKVRVARLKSSAQYMSSDSVNVSSSTTSYNNSNTSSSYELISWLKNITESENTVASNEIIFKEMRISAASNLSFTELQGVEYAFYDTNEKASLGYLRFKPRQIKPKKKAKRFHLHFVTLVGNFRITANDKESRVGVGDMVAIEKSVYYDIENITDDIGILMVIKK